MCPAPWTCSFGYRGGWIQGSAFPERMIHMQWEQLKKSELEGDVRHYTNFLGLTTTKMCSLIILEPRRLKSRCQQAHTPSRDSRENCALPHAAWGTCLQSWTWAASSPGLCSHAAASFSVCVCPSLCVRVSRTNVIAFRVHSENSG